MRVTTAFNHLLRLQGANVREVTFEEQTLEVRVALRRRRLVCPYCTHSTAARYDTRDVDSAWRHLDLGAWRLLVKARLRRLRCPSHGVVTEGVPFAEAGSGFTRDFEDLVAWCAARMDKTACSRLLRIAWRTVGAICTRVVASRIDPARLEGLFDIGIDEISWRRRHNYVTLVTDHRSGKVVWGGEGKGKRTTERFFAELGAQGAAGLRAVSMDMAEGYAAAVRERAPQAEVCFDPFHVVAMGTRAVDEVRREAWRLLRHVDPRLARAFRYWRWVLVKNPENLTPRQAGLLEAIRRDGGGLWRAYELKEALRGLFAGDLSAEEAKELLASWCERAQGSGMRAFAKLASTVHAHAEGILAGLRLGLTNARAEAINTKVRLITRRAYGFHSAAAAIALVMLACGPVTLRLPYERLGK
ncbi:MAG: ISL3 family transposase [Actinomycetota bacterium]